MNAAMSGSTPTAHAGLAAWVAEMAAHCRPDRIHWCDGSPEERTRLLAVAREAGVLEPLDPVRRPGCWYHRSDPGDVARVEECTWICTPTADEAGPTNRWADPAETRRRLLGWLAGSMAGRTMYVVPYLMGPAGSPLARVGIELTDSVYVALSMGIMTRMGRVALDALGGNGRFNRGLHGMLDLDPAKRAIAHFPQDDAIISTGSNYGGNVLLGKKCLALRLGSWAGRAEGWMAEHMLIVAITDPAGRRSHIAAAFPSACGKTNLAMLTPPARMPGWKVETVGDDIAWLRPGPDGRLWAINPENGYFGVAPGTSPATNPVAMATIARDTIFTNTGRTADGDVWWEGLGPAPVGLTDWRGRPWRPGGEPCAHPNSRFAVPMANNPMLAAAAHDPAGVPIDAIIIGGRRADTYPLIIEARDWTHGTYLASVMGSETTAAAAGIVGRVRRDPMAMLPFCGYHMGDYWQHWLDMGARMSRPPRIFHVNWFRKDAAGGWLWPGFGENLRVLAWILARCQGRAEAEAGPLGLRPMAGGIPLDGLGLAPERLALAQRLDRDEWRSELLDQAAWYDRIGRVPAALRAELRKATTAIG
jgi:phosphoenolpyruvate carboxykinase (GTP)